MHNASIYVCTLWEIMMVKEKLILVCSESRVDLAYLGMPITANLHL